MDEDKNKILNYAHQKFLTGGFYKVSMDEIASELRMSKKTIYKYFPSKEKLVEEVSLQLRENMRDRVKEIIKSDENAVVKIIGLLRTVGEVFAKVDERMMVDLQKHLPKIWAGIDEFRTKQINQFFTLIVNQGKKEGFIIDFPIEIIMTIYISSIRAVINPTFVMNNKFTFKEAMEFTFRIILNGILTDKGKKLFNQSIKGLDNE
ncbi:MAG: TetR/AcrR family transcriptional regulator [Ignavibacteriales bacterium]|nr:TetR/AcrR family transcriptional regulator [Ignavibacteriales bacterium]